MCRVVEQGESGGAADDGGSAQPLQMGGADHAANLLHSRKSTLHLIDRAIERLVRAGGRKSEAESAHLLEGIAVVVYDPDTGTINDQLPKPGSGLRWEEFVSALALSYKARFED